MRTEINERKIRALRLSTLAEPVPVRQPPERVQPVQPAALR
jgi:hypothetical protein